MQYAVVEVEYNIVASDQLRVKSDRDRRKSRTEASTSDSSIVHPQVDELTKLVKSLSAEMEKLKFEGKRTYRNTQNVDNRGGFRRPNNAPQTLTRDPRKRERDDQKIQTPLQNNLLADEEGEDGEYDPQIHCLGDNPPSPHLTQSTYGKSLMDNQINELSKGEKEKENPSKYDLRSKKKGEKTNASNQPTKTKKSSKVVIVGNKEKFSQSPPILVEYPIPEVKEILKSPPSFSYENEIQKIKIPVPFLELKKNEEVKKCLYKMLLFVSCSNTTDSVNIQDEKPAVILGPLIEYRYDSSPPFYTSLNIHDNVLHNCLMDSGHLPISCPKQSWMNLD
jgi:hypothetical protein